MDSTPDRPNRPGWLPRIDTARCTGCGWCVGACESHLLSLESVQWKKVSTLHDAPLCTGCSDCAVRCPFHVITMYRAEPAPATAATTAATAPPRSPASGRPAA